MLLRCGYRIHELEGQLQEEHRALSILELEEAYARAEERFPGEVDVPDFWGGYRVRPEVVELWQGRPSRLHDRLVYQRDGEGWTTRRLAP